eukprot:5999148-Prymnesium_polylepis.1
MQLLEAWALSIRRGPRMRPVHLSVVQGGCADTVIRDNPSGQPPVLWIIRIIVSGCAGSWGFHFRTLCHYHYNDREVCPPRPFPDTTFLTSLAKLNLNRTVQKRTMPHT